MLLLRIGVQPYCVLFGSNVSTDECKWILLKMGTKFQSHSTQLLRTINTIDIHITLKITK